MKASKALLDNLSDIDRAAALSLVDSHGNNPASINHAIDQINTATLGGVDDVKGVITRPTAQPHEMGMLNTTKIMLEERLDELTHPRRLGPGGEFEPEHDARLAEFRAGMDPEVLAQHDADEAAARAHKATIEQDSIDYWAKRTADEQATRMATAKKIYDRQLFKNRQLDLHGGEPGNVQAALRVSGYDLSLEPKSDE